MSFAGTGLHSMISNKFISSGGRGTFPYSNRPNSKDFQPYDQLKKTAGFFNLILFFYVFVSRKNITRPIE
jgi:hypothetical protein